MSSRELIVRYLAERARPRALVPLAALLAAAGALSNPRGQESAFDLAIAAVAALAFVLAFRVWDDLEDRTRDAREHPGRVTVIVTRHSPLIAVSLGLAAAGASLVALGPRIGVRLAAAGVAAVVLFVWYRLRPEAPRGVINGHVVLLKYPAFAFAVSPAAPAPAVLASLYLALCVFEVIDDPTLRGSVLARRIAMSECALVIATAFFLGGRLS